MPSLTRIIEQYIHDLLEEKESEALSLRRKELAERFGCVPSQINYVLGSRFTPERGFIVESQRGGHGYIRITRIHYADPAEKIKDLEEWIGSSISEQDVRRVLSTLRHRGLLTKRDQLLIEVALRYLDEQCRTEFEVSPFKKSVMQADLLKRFSSQPGAHVGKKRRDAL